MVYYMERVPYVVDKIKNIMVRDMNQSRWVIPQEDFEGLSLGNHSQNKFVCGLQAGRIPSLYPL